MSKPDRNDPSSAGARSGGFRMADLARIAGVSTSTVSRALADSPLVNDRTKERIRALAKQKNYRLNTMARNFRLKEALTLGVVIPAAEEADWRMSDPFFLELLGGIADAVNERGHHLLLSKMSAQSADWIEAFVETHTTDGLILIGQGMQHERIDEIASLYGSVVVWGARVSPEQSYITVGSDNELGGYLATRHLIDQGRRRIAFIGNTALPEAKLRFDGYRRALAEAGLDFDPALEQTPANRRDAGYEAARELLARVEPDAIFAFSDMFAIGAIRVLREAGLAVPRDVSVVGYDDLEIAAYYHPSITSIHQDRHDGGRLLVERLLARIAGEPSESVTLDTRIIVRESSLVPGG